MQACPFRTGDSADGDARETREKEDRQDRPEGRQGRAGEAEENGKSREEEDAHRRPPERARAAPLGKPSSAAAAKPAAKPAKRTKVDRAPKTRPETASVTGFLAALPDPQQRADSEIVLDMMRAATGCEPVMWGSSIVGFDQYRYRYDSGREGDMPIVGFSPRKQSLVLYIMPGFADHDALLARLGKHSTGKSCLYVKRLADVDRGVLERLVRGSVEEMRRRHRAGQAGS